MIHIDQIAASFSRSIRIFLRDKAIFGSSIFVPIFFLIVLPEALFHDTPSEVMPFLKGYITIAMITLLIMTTGMSNLAGSIAADRNQDLYSKLSSMPVSPLSEGIGRVMTVIVFSSIGSIVVLAVGLVTGARLMVSAIDLIAILGVGLSITLISAGIGFMVSATVKSESAASHVGLAIVLANYFIGIAVPYNELPDILKGFAQINPLSAGNNKITAIALNQDFVGYNPWVLPDVGFMVISCIMLITMGLLIYSRYCWRR
jgi:ABC-2 type transport system permease protein